MERKPIKLSFVEYLRDALLDTDYDSMASRADVEAENLAKILHENLFYTGKDGKQNYEVEMTEAEFKFLTKCMQEFVDEFYGDAVELVDEANEDARDYEESRQAYLEGRF